MLWSQCLFLFQLSSHIQLGCSFPLKAYFGWKKYCSILSDHRMCKFWFPFRPVDTPTLAFRNSSNEYSSYDFLSKRRSSCRKWNCIGCNVLVTETYIWSSVSAALSNLVGILQTNITQKTVNKCPANRLKINIFKRTNCQSIERSFLFIITVETLFREHVL